MEKYEAIIKCINDKLKDNETLLEYYREETSKKDRRILELEEEVKALREKLHAVYTDKERQI